MSLKWIPFTLNGQVQKILVNPKRTLLDVVRNDFGLVGTKEGCTEGICGLCTMLIDGKPINTCVYPVEKAAGKQILTIEGIGRPDKLHPIQEAFKQAGAAQCGYCTPGMVLLAKAILDHNPHPARDEVRKRISRNLCRCTGYEKIIDGVMLAAKFLQDPVALDQAKKERLDLGGRVPQLNSPEKVTGQMRYTADIRINGICHAKVLRSSYAHAKILSLDTRDAEKMSGVVTVCTAKDIKGVNKIEDDLRVLADHVVRYPGEPVAIVVAYTEEIAASALNKIKVAYEELPSLTNPLDAIKPGAIEILPDEFRRVLGIIDFDALKPAVHQFACVHGAFHV